MTRWWRAARAVALKVEGVEEVGGLGASGRVAARAAGTRVAPSRRGAGSFLLALGPRLRCVCVFPHPLPPHPLLPLDPRVSKPTF